MSNCWKCGKQLPEGKVECDYGCEQGDGFPTDAQIKEALRRQNDLTVTIDWEKIQTVADVREFLRCCYGDRIYFPFGIPDAAKRFIKNAERGTRNPETPES